MLDEAQFSKDYSIVVTGIVMKVSLRHGENLIIKQATNWVIKPENSQQALALFGAGKYFDVSKKCRFKINSNFLKWKKLAPLLPFEPFPAFVIVD